MPDPQVTTREQWLKARASCWRGRRSTRQRDAVNADRRRLPMVESRRTTASPGRTARSCPTCSTAGASCVV